MARLDRCFDLEDIRGAARSHLPRGVFEFMDRGAESETAMAENRDAFKRLKLRARVMRDLSERDMGTTLFGKRVELPVVIAPTATAGLCWFQGELALARAARAMGIPFTLAANSITSMEDVAGKAGGQLWFQLYMWKEEELSLEIARRARDLGYEVLVVTVDTALGRTREYNDRNGFTDPISLNPRFVTDMALHPRWLLGVIGRYVLSGGMPRHENYPDKYRHRITRRNGEKPPAHTLTLNWKAIERIRKIWPGPIVIKGLMTAEDAVQAVEHGADGVVVSNHGGRALDSAPATVTMLPEVVDAIGGRATIFLDSGIRHGSDIVKALAIGADAVLVGRATLYGIAAGGQAGGEKVLKLLATQFEKNMGYVGCPRVADLDRTVFAHPGARP